jgi:hypothetical protein
MVNFVPYFAGFITILFGVAFALAITKANREKKV